jgi:hypothetical protein
MQALQASTILPLMPDTMDAQTVSATIVVDVEIAKAPETITSATHSEISVRIARFFIKFSKLHVSLRQLTSKVNQDHVKVNRVTA